MAFFFASNSSYFSVASTICFILLLIYCITLTGSYFNLYKFLNNFKYWKLCADFINDVVGHKISKEIMLMNKLATKPFFISILCFKMPWDLGKRAEWVWKWNWKCLSTSYELEILFLLGSIYFLVGGVW